MAKSTVAVRFTGDVAGLKRSLSEVDGKIKGVGSKIGGFAKTAAIGLGAVGVGAGVMAKGFVDAAIESQKVTKQTAAVIKSMGGASNVTAEQVASLSEKLSMQSGVDDELIQSGQNVLLTFGKVRNEVGKGNDIFTRATQNALDMSVALGTDLKAANIQVGKALNDPIKGVNALTRAGVSFTQDQKDMIKTLVKSGKTLDAQKIILGELDKQFGGSAKAQATASDRLKVAWGNLQEELGARLLPVVEKVASFLANNLPGAIAVAERFFNTNLRPAFEQVAQVVRNNWPQIKATVEQVMAAVSAAVGTVVAFVKANWPQIQAVITTVMTTVSTVVSGAVSVIQTLWNNFGNNILSFVQRVWPAVQQVINGVMTTIRGIIQTITSLIKGDWSGVWNGIKGIVSGVWQAIQGIVKGALEGVRLVVGAALEVVGSMFKSAWNGIVDFFKGVPGRISDIASGMFDGIKNAFKSAINWIIRAWNGLEFKIPGFDPPGPGPKFAGFTLGVPDITPLAEGGIVKHRPGGILANIGEGRYDEAVVPLRPGMSLGQPQIIQLVVDGKILAEVVRKHERSLR